MTCALGLEPGFRAPSASCSAWGLSSKSLSARFSTSLTTAPPWCLGLVGSGVLPCLRGDKLRRWSGAARAMVAGRADFPALTACQSRRPVRPFLDDVGYQTCGGVTTPTAVLGDVTPGEIGLRRSAISPGERAQVRLGRRRHRPSRTPAEGATAEAANSGQFVSSSGGGIGAHSPGPRERVQRSALPKGGRMLDRREQMSCSVSRSAKSGHEKADSRSARF